MSPRRSWKLASVSGFWGSPDSTWTPLGDFRAPDPSFVPRGKFLATPLLLQQGFLQLDVLPVAITNSAEASVYKGVILYLWISTKKRHRAEPNIS